MFSTVLTPVHDLDATKAFWTALLGDPTSDSPYYVGWTLEGQEIGLVPNGHAQGMASTTAYWHTDEIAAATAAVLAAGGSVVSDASDVGGGRLVGLVADAEDHMIGLIQDAHS